MDLTSYIKYCLGYIKLTRERTFAAQQKQSCILPKKYFGIIGLLNGDIDGKLGELINLEIFYKFDPKGVPEELVNQYEEEKKLANKIEDIYNKYRNDQFTKQIVLNFGYFEIEIPIEIEDNGVDVENLETEQTSEPKVQVDRYPLFSLPVKIEKEFEKGVGKYLVYPVDPEIQVNIGMLEQILGEDLYYQLIEEIGTYELDDRLSLPITSPDMFIEIWHKIKAQLRLKEAKFDENSFSFEDVRIALSPRANYFLAEDLQKLSKLTEDELKGTALTGWVEDDELNIESTIPHEEDLYFPFLYDKYQLRVLSIINNRAAIVQGPPGTGKSETIANLLCHLAATGKRVLFVSQKAQALKVVKDKLKKLGVKYLFGYLPNPSSAQLGEEDEIDGIAPHLTALDAHIEAIGFGPGARKQPIEHDSVKGSNSMHSLGAIIEEKAKLKQSLNDAIGKQRRYYQLQEDLRGLQQYDIAVTDIYRFEKNLSRSEWRELKQLTQASETLRQTIHRYEQQPEKIELAKTFSGLDFRGKKYSVAFRHILDDVAQTAYDRHSRFFRKLNNLRRNLRLRKMRTALPREIIDYIDQMLSEDTSRNQVYGFLDRLYHFVRYFEQVDTLLELESQLKTKLTACGMSNKEYEMVGSLVSQIPSNDPEEVKQKILQVQKIKKELLECSRVEDPNGVWKSLKGVEYNRRERVAMYIENIINQNIMEKWKRGVTVRQIIKKLARAFGKSKKAYKTFDNLRKDPDNFNAILDLIPVWIMELDDASRIIPLAAGIFDYVILDEASQCNVAYTLPVTFRSKRALFVGDSEQMRDNTIIFKSNKAFDELAHRYRIAEELQIKATGAAVQSVLDIATLRGFLSIPLRYHYRSPKELIGFSNKYFYTPKGKALISLNNNYLVHKGTNRVMLLHQIEANWKEEFSDKVSVGEAKAILKLFKELREDERYGNKSIGILTFFNAQAAYIRLLFEKEGYREEKDNYKVSIIEGIQGDEKDIILYSFVIRSTDQKNKYIPLTGEGGDIRADINRGRVNVAFSRARLQVHCFISMPIAEFPQGIWVKKYLKYIEDSGEIDFNSDDLKPFDSHFEEEFCQVIRAKLKKGWKIQNQVESCGFKIDFVISNLKSGKKIAIECDGPTHFKDEVDEEFGIHIESDEERQAVLEAAGWEFYRLKYSDWINAGFNRERVVEDLIQLLH